jgi:hypothetical protein
MYWPEGLTNPGNEALLVLFCDVKLGRWLMYGDRFGTEMLEDATEDSLSLDPGRLRLCLEEVRKRSGDLEVERGGIGGLRWVVLSISLSLG